MRLSTLSRVVLVIFASTCALAQRYTFQLYGRAEGLTNLTPISVLQDRTGFLWVGTQNGLFRYDGSQFEAFNGHYRRFGQILRQSVHAGGGIHHDGEA